MLKSFSNPCLIPDDFSVPCRLRRTEESSSHESDGGTTVRQQLNQQQPKEMTCTMRKWHRETNAVAEFMSPHRRNASNNTHDAELILTPVVETTSLSRRRCYSGEYEFTGILDANTPVPLSKRFASFGTTEFISPEDPAQHNWPDAQDQSESHSEAKEDITIPLHDIIMVRTLGEDDGKSKNSRKSTSASKKDSSSNEECRQQPAICITISSAESYELLMESTNEQLVLLTFLKVNSKQGKVDFVTGAYNDRSNSEVDRHPMGNNKGTNDDKTVFHSQSSTKYQMEEDYQSMMINLNPSNLTTQSSGERSFDVEALTAKRMEERLETENLMEKLERRFYRLFSSLDDLSSTLTKCACGCFGDSSIDNTVMLEKDVGARERRNTESTVSLTENEKLEVDLAVSMEDSTAVVDSSNINPSISGKKATSDIINQTGPIKPATRGFSGLSIESEDLRPGQGLSASSNYQLVQMRMTPAVQVMSSDI